MTEKTQTQLKPGGETPLFTPRPNLSCLLKLSAHKPKYLNYFEFDFTLKTDSQKFFF